MREIVSSSSDGIIPSRVCVIAENLSELKPALWTRSVISLSEQIDGFDHRNRQKVVHGGKLSGDHSASSRFGLFWWIVRCHHGRWMLPLHFKRRLYILKIICVFLFTVQTTAFKTAVSSIIEGLMFSSTSLRALLPNDLTFQHPQAFPVLSRNTDRKLENWLIRTLVDKPYWTESEGAPG